MEKTCVSCGNTKSMTAEYFYRGKKTQTGFRASCKECENKRRKNDPLTREMRRQRDRRPEAVERKRRYDKEYKKLLWNCPEFREKRRKYQNERRKELNNRLRHNLGVRIRAALKGLDRSVKTERLLGCSIEEFKGHLKRQFQEGMSFNNYGEWHIDHIVPCAKFNLTDPEQQKICFHYTNLQPLWATDNFSKYAKLPHELKEACC